MPSKKKDGDRPGTGGSADKGEGLGEVEMTGEQIAEAIASLKEPNPGALFELRTYPEHAPIYDELWSVFPDATGATESEYVASLKAIFKACHNNATAAGAETVALRLWEQDGGGASGVVSLSDWMLRLSYIARVWAPTPCSSPAAEESFLSELKPHIVHKSGTAWKGWDDVKPMPGAGPIRVDRDVEDYVADAEERRLRRIKALSPNRVCVVGQPGVGGDKLGRTLAERLGAVHLCAEDCAVAEALL
eukprot:Hpha_TRINITY_DN30922_c0_g1::TRINITY_DN30922_c0_g1_i1::g.112287::m.112287